MRTRFYVNKQKIEFAFIIKEIFQSTSNLNGGSSSVLAIWLSSLMFVFEIIWLVLGILTNLKTFQIERRKEAYMFNLS